ncbi:MAG TPA: PEP-CTERM sorting domain-containing protein [Rhodocyclaceae bacterium]|nr:PEP-CTERM sorting domain-containing protein [Rhodocyclaceae bacterium]
MKKIAVIFFTLMTMVCCGVVQATPIKWTLSGVTLSDAAGVTGSFFYDAATGIYSNWSILVGAGSLSGFTYNVPDSQDAFVDATDLLVITNSDSRYFNFSFAAPLTAAGGSVLIDTTPDAEFDESSWESNNGSITRFVTAGSVVAATANVPEPGSLLLTAAALIGLIVSRKKANIA